MKYSVKIFTHRLPITDLPQAIAKTIAYYAMHNITLSIDAEETAVLKPDVPTSLFIPNDGKYDVVVYMYDRATFPEAYFGLAFPVSPTLRGIYLACDTVDDGVDYTWKSLAHELLHTLVYKFDQENNVTIYNALDFPLVNGVVTPYYQNDTPDAVGGNFLQQWALINKYNTMWKYFKTTEQTGSGHTVAELKTQLVDLLDKARSIAGIPFVITSGFRTTAENTTVGGVSDSAHETGLAVDLLIKDGISGEKINSALHQVGFTRFGYYQDGHLHVDMDLTKPNPCFWIK